MYMYMELLLSSVLVWATLKNDMLAYKGNSFAKLHGQDQYNQNSELVWEKDLVGKTLF